MSEPGLSSSRPSEERYWNVPARTTAIDAAVKDFPPALRGTRPKGFPHSPWEILEHLRLAQWDILEFSRDAKHVSPDWPSGYWPESPAPPSEKAWDESVAQFRADLAALA